MLISRKTGLKIEQYKLIFRATTPRVKQPMSVFSSLFLINKYFLTSMSCFIRNNEHLLHVVDEDSKSNEWTSIDDLEIDHSEMKVFLKSIIFMPKHMWVLCLCNLFCWMSLVTYSLYFTDYVGQFIFKGMC